MDDSLGAAAFPGKTQEASISNRSWQSSGSKQSQLAPVGRRILDLAEEQPRSATFSTKPPAWCTGRKNRGQARPLRQPLCSPSDVYNSEGSSMGPVTPPAGSPRTPREATDAKAAGNDEDQAQNIDPQQRRSGASVDSMPSSSSNQVAVPSMPSSQSNQSPTLVKNSNASSTFSSMPSVSTYNSQQRKIILKQTPPAADPHLDSSEDSGLHDTRSGSLVSKIRKFASGCAGSVSSARRRISRSPAQDSKNDGYATAIDLLVLSFTVCAASPAECIAFCQTLAPRESCALKNLAELAGALKPDRNIANLAKAFLGKPEDGEKQPERNSLKRTDSQGSIGSARRRGGSQGSDHAHGARAAFQMRGKSASNMSLGSKRSSKSAGTDVSETSFADFSRRNGVFRVPSQPLSYSPPGGGGSFSAGDASRTSFSAFVSSQVVNSQDGMVRDSSLPLMQDPKSKPFVIDLQLPNEMAGPILERKRSVHFNENESSVGPDTNGVTTIVPERSEAGYSAVSAISYNSMCDAVVVGEDGEKEVVQAEVLNLGNSAGGLTQVRIGFRSQCLRTQNEWQRQLLAQQRSLVTTMTTQLEDAQQILRAKDEVQEEEKELLKSFRKIITREVDMSDKTLSLEVFVLEKSKAISSEIEALCQILEFPCHIFKSFTAIKEAVALGTARRASSPGLSPKSMAHKNSIFSKQVRRSMTSNMSIESQDTQPLNAVFLGSDWVTRQLPVEWKKSTVYVVLSSQPSEFEVIGKKLSASSSSEIHECLINRGFSEFLLHPLSLEGIRQVLTGAMSRHFGQEFLLTKVIGRGASSVVYRAKRLRDGALFALKEINTMRLSKSAQAETAQETELLRILQWPTVLELVDAWFVARDKLRYLLMPLLEGGDIEQYMTAIKKNGQPRISQALVTDWYMQTLHGLSYLHSCGVLHRDLKPGNFLLDKEDRVLQIADLGHAMRLPGSGPHPARKNFVQARACTPLYAAPELADEVCYSGSDMWAVGASFFEMLTLKTLFPQTLSREDHWASVAAFDPDGKQVEGDATNIAFESFDALRPFGDYELTFDIKQMLRRDPLRRPTAANLALRPNILKRIYDLVKETQLSAQPKEHFEDFKKLLKVSQQAENLDPPDLSDAEQSGTGSLSIRQLSAKERRKSKQFHGMKAFMNTV